MRENEDAQFILYYYNIKVWQAVIQKGRKQAFKEAENVSEGHFSALYVIIEVSSPPPWICPLCPILTDIQPLPPL